MLVIPDGIFLAYSREISSMNCEKWVAMESAESARAEAEAKCMAHAIYELLGFTN
jgi:hypothetical protein